MIIERMMIHRHIIVLLVFLIPTLGSAYATEPTANDNDSHISVVEQSRSNSPADNEEQPLSINEPIYVVVGRSDGDMRARFQFSFKLQMFDSDSALVKSASWLEKLHFAYTQTSLWNLSADSSPFEDTSYRPSVFWELVNPNIRSMPNLLRFGYEHESNGQGNDLDAQGRRKSRSIDMLFMHPFWKTGIGGRTLVLGPKLYAYVSKGHESQDIADYRGYMDLIMRYGTEDSWLVNALWRHGTENKNTVQFDLSYPFRKKFFARAGGYYYIQSFYGYGDSLLAYDQRKDFTVRFGFAIVR